jgi:cell division protein FtsQ
MPRVSRSPRNSVKDRPSKTRMVMRRLRRYARPAGWVAFAGVVVLLGMVVLQSARPGGMIASLRDRLGGASASAGMRVKNIVIEGRANTPEPLLRAAIGVSIGDPMLGFSLEATRARIETLTWVEQATVERRLPDTLVVFLQERAPFAVWQHLGKFVLVDRAGKLVANQDVAQFRNLPLIVGSRAPDAAAPLLDALRDRPALQARVVAAVRVGERRWNLHMNNGADVMLPEGHEVAALDRLAQLQQDHALLDRPLASIDMRLPDKLTLRPKGEPEPAPVAGKKPT